MVHIFWNNAAQAHLNFQVILAYMLPVASCSCSHLTSRVPEEQMRWSIAARVSIIVRPRFDTWWNQILAKWTIPKCDIGI